MVETSRHGGRGRREWAVPRALAFAVIALSIWIVGDPARAALVSEERIEQEAERAFQQMRARIPLSQDPAARDYVECVVRSIIAQLDEPYRDHEWEIELFEHDAANAFAMPGGKIGVFTGIFRVAEDQHALAAVLGHEVAHVISQHALKRARKTVRNQLLVVAASSALGGGRRTTDVLGLGAQVGLELPYDRKQEKQADTEGLLLMSNAGFDPRSSISLWKNMARQSQAAPPQLLSTHPATDDRLDALISQLTPSLIAFNEAHGRGYVPQCR